MSITMTMTMAIAITMAAATAATTWASCTPHILYDILFDSCHLRGQRH